MESETFDEIGMFVYLCVKIFVAVLREATSVNVVRSLEY